MATARLRVGPPAALRRVAVATRVDQQAGLLLRRHVPLPLPAPGLRVGGLRGFHPTLTACKQSSPGGGGNRNPVGGKFRQLNKSRSDMKQKFEDKNRPPYQPPPPPPRGPNGRQKEGERKGEEKTPENFAEFWVRNKKGLVAVGLSGSIFFGYLSYLITVYFKTTSGQQCCNNPAHAPSAGQSKDAVGDDGRPWEPESEAPTGLPQNLTKKTAQEFDTELDWPEWLMGVTKLRRRLASECKGHVLEVAVGTGRNIAYYDWDDVADDPNPERRTVRRLDKRRIQRGFFGSSSKEQDEQDIEIASYTGIDISPEALEIARSKIRNSVPGLKNKMRKVRSDADEKAGNEQFERAGAEEFLNLQGGKVRLIRADAQKALPLPPQDLPPPLPPPPGSSPPPSSPTSPEHYDVVIQNFGLCSVPSPVSLLSNMAGVVKPDTGRILLLEHGRGTWGFVNKILDSSAAGRFRRYGCWWNRDIERIVRDAARAVPGLEVVSVERPGWTQFGTALLIELRVNSKAAAATDEAATKE